MSLASCGEFVQKKTEKLFTVLKILVNVFIDVLFAPFSHLWKTLAALFKVTSHSDGSFGTKTEPPHDAGSASCRFKWPFLFYSCREMTVFQNETSLYTENLLVSRYVIELLSETTNRKTQTHFGIDPQSFWRDGLKVDQSTKLWLVRKLSLKTRSWTEETKPEH